MYLKTIFSAFLGLFLMVAAIAQPEFIDAKQFMELKKASEDLVVVDASKASSYGSSHIKGAIHINYNDLHQDGDVTGILANPEEVAMKLGEFGIGDDTDVVLYDDGSQKYSSRLYWVLEYLGKENVKILHKDLDDWRSARIPLTGQPATAEKKVLTPKVNPDVLVSLDYVKENKDKPGVVLIDSRTEGEYNGTSRSEGHIPGAIHLNYEDVLTENGAFKPVDELKMMAGDLGLTPDKELIFYCKTSVRATVSFIAFKHLLGFDKVRVYDGAYNEWVVDNAVAQ